MANLQAIAEKKALEAEQGATTEQGNNAMLAQMDTDAKAAFIELAKLDQEAVKKVAGWYAVWYLKAGHKRLGRGLAKLGKK